MDRKYFAAKSAEETARIVLTKAEGWFIGLDSNGYLDKLREATSAYYGGYFSDPANAHKITFGGEQGELTNLPVNHFRNLCRHILVMVTATRPAMQARATNTDYKSLVQTKLANGLLDYYLREKRLEDYFKRAIETAIVMGSGYVKLEWNATAGEAVDFNEDTNTPIYEGDVLFKTLTPFDVVFDPTKEDSSLHDWVLCRTSKNRFDLAAKYPELESKILNVPSKSSKIDVGFYGSMNQDQTDDVYVYEFYHRRTESMPNGRYMLFLESDVVLLDVPMPYRDLPVYRVSAADILGTPFGYSDVFDVLPIQNAINSLYSTILTNQTTFGVQNVLVPRGCEVDTNVLSGGLNVIEYNDQFGKPESMNLTNTPAEVFSFLQQLEKTIETLSGVNSVSRGNPESSLKSGNALALVSSMALQYASGLQQSYVKLIEDTGTGLINILKDYASVPRIATIVGEANRSYMKEFTGDDLSGINRVIVDVSNPLSKTTAGKSQMATELLQMGLIETPQQYITVLNTGNLDTMTDDIDRTMMLVRAENDKMVAGEDVVAVATEKHSIHIKQHMNVLADPDLKNDPELVTRVLAHIQEHLDLLRTTDPNLLMINNEQPLAPLGGSPANQPSPDQMVNQSQIDPNAPQNQQVPNVPMNNPAEQAGVNMPSLPQPPGEFASMPVTAEQMTPQG
jgi:hypothetical protein